MYKKMLSILFLLLLLINLAVPCFASGDDNADKIHKLIIEHIVNEMTSFDENATYTEYFLYDDQRHIIGRQIIHGDTETNYTYIYNPDGTFDEIIERKIINTIFETEVIDKSYMPPDVDNVDDINYPSTIPTKEIEFLKENKILLGDPDGGFRENDLITRAEFVTILCRAIGIEELAQSEEMRNKEIYVDVPKTHWAAGYINAATEHGAINGMGNNMFCPEMSVTNEQAVKILVAAWGYTNDAEKMGGYPNGYMAVAQQLGVTDSVLINYGLASKRWVVSVFTYNMLSVVPKDIKLDLAALPKVEKSIDSTGENGLSYISDPAEILKNITPETIDYERTFFEQKIPEGESVPLKTEGKRIIHTNDKMYESADFTICGIDDKDGAYTNLKNCSEIDISSYETGDYRAFITYKKNNVIDSYYIDLLVTSDSIIPGSAYRITYLKYQPIFEEKNTEINIDSNSEYQIPFNVVADSDNKGKVVLCINYPEILKRDTYFSYDIVTEDNKTFSERIDGKYKAIETLVIDNLKLGHKYHFTIGIYGINGSRNAIKGTLELKNDNGEVDFSFNGNHSIVAFKGYIIGDDWNVL